MSRMEEIHNEQAEAEVLVLRKMIRSVEAQMAEWREVKPAMITGETHEQRVEGWGRNARPSLEIKALTQYRRLLRGMLIEAEEIRERMREDWRETFVLSISDPE